jgi:hypothetical protein
VGAGFVGRGEAFRWFVDEGGEEGWKKDSFRAAVLLTQTERTATHVLD